MTKVAFCFPGQGSLEPGMGKEIAEAAGISKGTVKSTASRGLEALQRAMQQLERAKR